MGKTRGLCGAKEIRPPCRLVAFDLPSTAAALSIQDILTQSLIVSTVKAKAWLHLAAAGIARFRMLWHTAIFGCAEEDERLELRMRRKG